MDASSPWVTALAFPAILVLLSAYVAKRSARSATSAEKVSMDLLTVSQAEIHRLLAELDGERASGQHWYRVATAWWQRCHDLRHDANNQIFILGNLAKRAGADVTFTDFPPLPDLEDILK